MAGKSTTYANQLLALILNATAITGLAINATSSPLTNLYLALHTSSPGAGGTQTTNEAAYTGYARVALARSTAGFTCSGGVATLASAQNFPTATGGSETETFFSLGTAASGTGEILYFGPLSPNIAVSNGVTPQLTTGTTITET